MRIVKMNFKRIVQLFLLAVFGCVGTAHAISIGASPEPYLVNLDESGLVAINLDFDDESQGGAFRINFDNTIVANPSFVFEGDLNSKFGITEVAMGVDTGYLELSVGTLSFAQGVFGTGLLGYFTFDAIAEGEFILALNDVFGGFSDFTTFEPQDVNYQNTTIKVVSNVPVPAAVWFFASGLGILCFRKKNVNKTYFRVPLFKL